MENFDFQAPTNILFGKGQLQHLPRLLQEHGQRVLLTYGGGSIKRNGLYDEVQALLKNANMTVIELGGIDPNPRLETVKEGARLCHEHDIDVILAVGGGSTIDCSKAIAAAYYYDGDPWDFTQKRELATKGLPIVTVLTLAATGSEMNGGAVISNMETKEKLGMGGRALIPKASILDPTNTFTVPRYQTMAGSADILSHLIENYFSVTEHAAVQDHVAEGLMKTVLHYTPIALEQPEHYDARANLMWASSLALNGLTGSGKKGSWSCHPMEHELSAYYDITHGIGLAILTPRWLAHILNADTVEKIAAFGRAVLDVEWEEPWAAARQTIQRLYETFVAWGVPMTLGEVGIDREYLEEMAEQAVKHSTLATHAYVPLEVKDVQAIYEACLTPMTFTE
ncbi:iron-containing alcohol dehydrogenase [Vagococcus lutrae]|uniref:Iron-containing alcohol dehydrogenase n=1 Tax=Vagococcus lutrae TaxID=81947 RepID=A0AAF0BHR5_9ENTE|nr:iron-containing alcohol dehydrogenase [Vagococcus lutrae]MCO7151709.1 iron-containing alcohol dehydrogenase [Vagococcus lutrae]MDT2801589.1 iron-containing alcohol dehydrogenase [Vagococcus lutrae]MDT2813063.1 iron-containing alcohol dehydrogenase [Vagococcus lutrae]MDT2816672.1 iron-containing alcohol dehydrogenase [Vagococcus lutrae]MDT2819867.1 iron-containing alcohol dehydrogenase [Vagococcus lutrae]